MADPFISMGWSFENRPDESMNKGDPVASRGDGGVDICKGNLRHINIQSVYII